MTWIAPRTPTLVEFTDENYLKNALSNHADKKKKITVIEIPTEWFNLYFNEKDIKIRCDTIKIKTLIKQKFSKIEDIQMLSWLCRKNLLEVVSSHEKEKRREK